MIDTMGYFVPVSENVYDLLVEKSVMTSRKDSATGFLEFEYHSFRQTFSWDYRILWNLKTVAWGYDHKRNVPVELQGRPHLKIEFSVPKVIHGHNLISCTMDDAITATEFVKRAFEELFEVTLMPVLNWYPYRVDTCANYVLDSSEQVASYIRFFQKLNFPRRTGYKYEDESIYFASRHNTLKMYAKGPEFKAHDMKRFKNEVEGRRLYNEALCLLRIEVENKKRIRYLIEKHEEEQGFLWDKFNGYVNLKTLLTIFDEVGEMKRMVNKLTSGLETRPMKALEVYHRLKFCMTDRKANFYYGIYTMLVMQGQNVCKANVKKSAFYNALKIFRELNIPIVTADLDAMEIALCKGFPADFSLEVGEHNKYYQVPKAA